MLAKIKTIAWIIVAMMLLTFPFGVFVCNVHRGWADFTLRRTEVDEQIKAITNYWRVNKCWPQDLSKDVNASLPMGWEYHYFEKKPPFLQLAPGALSNNSRV